MKVAFVIYQNAVINGASNGVRSQALGWKRTLEKTGVECTLISQWDHYDWSVFDAIHIFGYDINISSFVTALSQKNANIFLSPIIDSQKPYWQYRLATLTGIDKLRIYSQNYALRKAAPHLKGFCVRSGHELRYIKDSFGVNPSRIHQVPLSYGLSPTTSSIESLTSQKRNFCLHVSSIYQDRKNVLRLVRAARKYGFDLILAGSTGSEKEFFPIKQEIGNAKNISVLGFVSKEELIQLYTEAKVFALPSTLEGVGIVALDAAMFGCNIAITSIKGPKEYFPNISTVECINPYDVDDIGSRINMLLRLQNNELLREHVYANFGENSVVQCLLKMYQ